jgi:hypothetical protein
MEKKSGTLQESPKRCQWERHRPKTSTAMIKPEAQPASEIFPDGRALIDMVNLLPVKGHLVGTAGIPFTVKRPLGGSRTHTFYR